MTVLLFMLSAAFLVQDGEGYFVDGTILTLKNGTVIQTTMLVKEDAYYFTWYEEGQYIAIDKVKVKDVDYFSYFVPNRKRPEVQVPDSVKRRLTGGSIAYGKPGSEKFRIVHVRSNGRSAAGMAVPNRVEELGFAGPSDQGYRPMQLSLSESTNGTELELRFYDIKGRRLFVHKVAMDDISQTRRERKKGTRSYQFQFPDGIPANQIGLVEAVNFN